MAGEKFMPAWQRKAHLVAIILLIFGGINYGTLVLFNTTIVQKVFGYGLLGRLIYGLIAVAAIAIMFHRDTYLPFLGETVMPACNILQERIPEGANTVLKVRVAPHAKVLYWAAEPTTEGLDRMRDWRVAYDKFKNAGITSADVRGNAYLKVRNPGPYRVPFKGRLDPHVHYRVCQQDGMMSRIETIFISDAGDAFAGDEPVHSASAPFSIYAQNTNYF